MASAFYTCTDGKFAIAVTSQGNLFALPEPLT